MKVFKQGAAFLMEDCGKVVEVEVTKDGQWLKLPENSVNRQYVSIAKVLKAPDETLDYGDIVKESRTISPNPDRENRQSAPRSSEWIEKYLDEEDKIVYRALVEKAKKKMQLEKLLAAKEELQRQIEELMK